MFEHVSSGRESGQTQVEEDEIRMFLLSQSQCRITVARAKGLVMIGSQT